MIRKTAMAASAALASAAGPAAIPTLPAADPVGPLFSCRGGSVVVHARPAVRAGGRRSGGCAAAWPVFLLGDHPCSFWGIMGVVQARGS